MAEGSAAKGRWDGDRADQGNPPGLDHWTCPGQPVLALLHRPVAGQRVSLLRLRTIHGRLYHPCGLAEQRNDHHESTGGKAKGMRVAATSDQNETGVLPGQQPEEEGGF